VSGDVDRFLELVLSNPVTGRSSTGHPAWGSRTGGSPRERCSRPCGTASTAAIPSRASWTNEKTSVNTRSMTQPQERDKFNNAEAPVLAKQLGFTHRAGQTPSSRFAYFEDESRFLVVAGAQEGTDVQRALASGVAHRGDRQLVIALPAGHTNATQQRSAWLTAGARPQLHEHNAGVVSPLQARTTDDTVAALRRKLGPDSPSAELAKASNRSISASRVTQYSVSSTGPPLTSIWTPPTDEACGAGKATVNEC